eukprot:3730848-Pyramimonas_sp.AAC.1
MWTLPLGPSAELPTGGTKRVRGVQEWTQGNHADPATGDFGGAPNGATRRVRVVPAWTRVNMRTMSPRPSVELLMGA